MKTALPSILMRISSNLTSSGVSDLTARKQRSPVTRNSFPEPTQFQRRSSNNRKSLNHEEYTRRDINSAPIKTQEPSQSPLPQINNLIKHNTGQVSNKQQYQNDYAGITTKERDNRQGRFATSWADTRVTENIVTRNNGTTGKSKDVSKSRTPPATHKQTPFRPKKPDRIVTEKSSDKLKENERESNNGLRDEKPKRDTETELHKLVTLALDKEKEGKPKSPRQKWTNSFPIKRILFEKTENSREEPTFKPNINNSDEVFTVYTGITKKELRKSNQAERPENNTDNQQVTSPATTPQSPRQKKEHMLSKRETGVYINIHAAYDNQNTQQQRKQYVINKMTKAQLEYIKQRNDMIRRREKRKQESKKRQQKQLTYLRQKFEREQCRRFRSQYVTHRVVEHEIMDREDYGLPQDLNEDDSVYKTSSAKMKRKQLKPYENVSESELRKRNEKKYEKMSGIYNHSSVYKHEKVPKMEGIDTVVVTEKNKDGKTIVKKKMVSDVIEEAKQCLDDDTAASSKIPKNHKMNKSKNKKSTVLSGMTNNDEDDELNKSLDSIDLDDDDDDIFERARKKYGLDVDSSLDANSRL